MATLCHFELKNFQMSRMRTVQKAKLLEMLISLIYIEHLRQNGSVVISPDDF